MKKLLFKKFENINHKNYIPTPENKTHLIAGKFKKGILNFKNDPPETFENIEFKTDSTISPSKEITRWKCHKNSIILLCYPYESMPKYNLEAGIEEQAYYLFISGDSSSMILSNSDGSIRELLIRKQLLPALFHTVDKRHTT